MEQEIVNNQANGQGDNKGKKMIWIVAAMLVILILAGGTYYFLAQDKESADTVSDSASTQDSVAAGQSSSITKSWQEGKVAIAGAYADSEIVDLGNGSYRMYYSAEPEIQNFKGQLYSAISTDGITWTNEAGERKQMATFPDAIKLADGRWRMYFQNAGVIKSAISTDGLKFIDEAGTRIDAAEDEYDLGDVGAPSTTRLGDGSYIMVYRGTYATKYAADVPNNNTQLLFYATSTDGLLWQKKGVALDSKNETFYGLLDGPEWVKWDDGKLRLYFWSYIGVYYVVYEDGNFSEPVLDFEASKDKMIKFAPNPPGDPTLMKIKDQWFMYYGQHTKGIYYSTLR